MEYIRAEITDNLKRLGHVSIEEYRTGDYIVKFFGPTGLQIGETSWVKNHNKEQGYWPLVMRAISKFPKKDV